MKMQVKSTTWNGKPRTSSAGALCRPVEVVGAAVLVILTCSCIRLTLTFTYRTFLSVQHGRSFSCNPSWWVMLWLWRTSGTRFVLETPRQACECGRISRSESPLDRGGYGEERSMVEILGQEVRWPERGYGAKLSLRIYVYDVEEIEGLRELLSGRDLSIASSACVKGQWGTQVWILLCFLCLQLRGVLHLV